MNYIKDFFEFLDGKKSYVVGICITVVFLLRLYDVIPEELFQQLLVLLGAGGLISIKSALKKIEK